MRLRVWHLAIVLLLPMWVQAQESPTAGVLVFSGGRVIDGFGGAPIENAVVVVRGNRIEAVGRAASVAIPERRAHHRCQRHDAAARPVGVARPSHAHRRRRSGAVPGQLCCAGQGNHGRGCAHDAPRPASLRSATRADRWKNSWRCAPTSKPAAPSDRGCFSRGRSCSSARPDPRDAAQLQALSRSAGPDRDAKEARRDRRGADQARRRPDQGVRLLGSGDPARDHRDGSRREHRRRSRRPPHHRLSHGDRGRRGSSASRVHCRRAVRLLGRGHPPARARRAADRHRADGEHPARSVHHPDHRDAPGLRARRRLSRAARSSALRTPVSAGHLRAPAQDVEQPGGSSPGASARRSASRWRSRS